MEFHIVRTQAFQLVAIEFYVFFVLDVSSCDHSQSVQLIWRYQVYTFWNVWSRFSLWILAMVISMVPACGLPICQISLDSIQAQGHLNVSMGKMKTLSCINPYSQLIRNLPLLWHHISNAWQRITPESAEQKAEQSIPIKQKIPPALCVSWILWLCGSSLKYYKNRHPHHYRHIGYIEDTGS